MLRLLFARWLCVPRLKIVSEYKEKTGLPNRKSGYVIKQHPSQHPGGRGQRTHAQVASGVSAVVYSAYANATK